MNAGPSMVLAAGLDWPYLIGVKNNRVMADASASPANASLISNFSAHLDKLGSGIASAQQAIQILNINENKEFEYVG